MTEERQIYKPYAATEIMNPKLRSVIVEQDGDVVFSPLAVKKQFAVFSAAFRLGSNS